eukprot:3067857-Rhodomonas_salina.2
MLHVSSVVKSSVNAVSCVPHTRSQYHTCYPPTRTPYPALSTTFAILLRVPSYPSPYPAFRNTFAVLLRVPPLPALSTSYAYPPHTLSVPATRTLIPRAQ